MPNSNNSINNTVGTSNSGNLNTLTVQNTDNTSTSSHSTVNVTVASTGSGNPSTTYSIPGTPNFTFEVNNSAGSALELLSGTTPVWTMSRAGQQNLPLQPAFMAFFNIGAPTGIPTGSATSGPPNQYNVGHTAEGGPGYTVAYDTRGTFNVANGFYTIPETGKYYFIAGLLANTVLNSDLDAQLSIVIGNAFLAPFRQQSIDIHRPAAIAIGGQNSFQTSGYDSYTAGQVVWVKFFVTGTTGAGNHITMFGNGSRFNFFAGHRVA